MSFSTPIHAKRPSEFHTLAQLEYGDQFVVNTPGGIQKLTVENLQDFLYSALVKHQIGARYARLGNSETLPACEVLLLGGVLDPQDFADGLETLKTRCPHLVREDGLVQLPNYLERYGVMDLTRPLADPQEDVMQKITGEVGYFQLGYNEWYGGRGAFNAVTGTITTDQGHGNDPGVYVYFDSSLVTRTAEVTRPKNITELATMVVGIPLDRANPKTFNIINSEGEETGQSVVLYQGVSGAYLGYNQEIMKPAEAT